MSTGVAGAAALILPFAGVWPRIDPEAWVAPGVTVIGDVEIGPGSSLWFGSVVRGDVHCVRIGARTNLQDLCVVHVTRHLFSTQLGDEITVGHRAVVHGCRIGDGALVGIGAIILDGAEVGEEALIGAGAVVTPGTKIPARVLALGAPARVIRVLSASEREEQRGRAHHYVALAHAHREGRAL